MEKLCLLPQNFLRSPVRMYGWMYVINFCVDGEVFSISYNILWKSKGNKITRWRMLYYQAWWKCRRRWWLMVCLIIGNGCVSYSYKRNWGDLTGDLILFTFYPIVWEACSSFGTKFIPLSQVQQKWYKSQTTE